jgi:sterol 3beta-glucosyltransferase
MKITIVTVGTRGDVQPYVALGMGLHAAGHAVTLATSARFEPFVAERGLRHAPLSADLMEMMETPQGKAAIAGKGLLTLIREVRPMLRQLLDQSWQAAQDAEALIYHPKILNGRAIAEKLSIPAFLAHPAPLFAATRAFPSPALPISNLGGALNKLSYRLVNAGLELPFRGLINAWRRETLGLPPARDEQLRAGQPIPQLYGYSPLVIPRPADWDDSVAVTGYWFLDRPASWQPSRDLVQFLDAGPAPVYIGFGSMAGRDAAKTTRIVLEALRRARVRAVLATGVGGLVASEGPDNVFLLDEAPHDWLFPRMAAIVHHGGAGTTAAALRAGRPQLICPFFGDQPFWGRRVAALGVGPQPIAQRTLSADRLTAAMRTLATDAALQTCAAELGAQIRAEDGVGRAVAVIDAALDRRGVAYESVLAAAL